MPDRPAIWDFVLASAQAIWIFLSAIAQDVWHFLCTGTEQLIDKLLPYPDAVAGSIYLLVVTGLAIAYVIVHPRVRHGFRKKAARHVWYFTLALLFFSGLIHAAERGNVSLDAVSPPIPFDILPGTKLALVGNSIIGVIAVMAYLWHAHNSGINVVQGFRPFFTPVLGLFGTEHLVGMYSHHYELNKATEVSLRFLHSLTGAVILQSLIAVLLTSGLAYLMQSYLRQRDAGMKDFEQLTDQGSGMVR